MAKDNYIYPAILDYADDGITITFPDLPGCVSCAKNDEEAYFMARDAMRGWLLVSEEYGDEIKEPTPLKDVALESNQRAMLVDVNLAFYREPHRNRAVKKTLTIPAWLNELAEKENVNFSYVLQNALRQQLNV
ncbi:type II toxin-antitoxin system HicB family antitoxin [Cloacibacillus sp. An23]|uniref:type II toxin-antitoxin system HicB family antitoxin n=1 Tax=Cloacibacillus sp. An23 TaxID=1965591 RepID=UPI000B58018A|nr:type II toxin-antitoxin system HicB family antitoxin [Cloacibacillus sp. An23]OUO94792.1 pilus assembly protein HicB [Cloacibacillus sp. An23]